MGQATDATAQPLLDTPQPLAAPALHRSRLAGHALSRASLVRHHLVAVMGRHSARWHRKPGWVRLLDYLDLQIPTSPIRYLAAAVFGLLFTEAVSILASIINQP